MKKTCEHVPLASLEHAHSTQRGRVARVRTDHARTRCDLVPDCTSPPRLPRPNFLKPRCARLQVKSYKSSRTSGTAAARRPLGGSAARRRLSGSTAARHADSQRRLDGSAAARQRLGGSAALAALQLGISQLAASLAAYAAEGARRPTARRRFGGAARRRLEGSTAPARRRAEIQTLAGYLLVTCNF